MYPFYTTSRSNNLGIGNTNTPRRLNTQPFIYPSLTINNTPLTTNNTPLTTNNTPLTSNNTPLTTNNTPLTSNRNALLERLNREKKLLQQNSGNKSHSTQSDKNREYMQKVFTFQQKLRSNPFNSNRGGCTSCRK
jgi:hypothetical protein